MGKLVVLRVRDGDFEKGFNVTLEIGEDGAPPSTVMEGTRCLPAAPYIPEQYSHWKSNYFELNGTAELAFRVKAGGGTGTPGTSSEIQKREEEKLFETFEKLKAECRKSAQKVESSINRWLNSNAFRPMEQKLRTELNTLEEVRVIIQTADNKIQKLPWHVWDFFEAFPNAEAALGSLEYKRVKRSTPATLKDKVKILAILGNSEGINVEKDREFLESLPNAKTLFLVEPKRKEFDKLWDESWDILFFAGHSSSKIDGQTGQIQINPHDELAIEQLENTLSQAIRNGLQLAIFNSCDGLGLARGLAGLHIPQTIVMRESVPDQVAQEFLKYFLKAFSSGSSLYSSVRQARKKLQELDGLEEEFPGATWFPVIYQNPAELPLNWKDLHSNKKWEQNYKHGLEWFLKKLDELFARNVISAKWSSYFSLRNLLICFGISLAYIIILTLLSYVLAGENPIFKAENISTPARILVGIVSLLILTSMEVSNRKAYFDATAGKFGFYQNHYSFIETFQQNFIVTDNLDKTDAKLDSLILSLIDKQTFFSKKKWNKVAFARWLVRGIGGVIFGFAQYCLTGDWLNTISVLIVAFLFGFAYAAGATFSFGIVSLFGSKFKSIGVCANFFWNIYSPLALIAVLGLIFMAKKNQIWVLRSFCWNIYSCQYVWDCSRIFYF